MTQMFSTPRVHHTMSFDFFSKNLSTEIHMSREYSVKISVQYNKYNVISVKFYPRHSPPKTHSLREIGVFRYDEDHSFDRAYLWQIVGDNT